MAARSFLMVIDQGADYRLTIPVLDSEDNPSSVVGWTAQGQIRHSTSDDVVLHEFDLEVETTSVALRIPADSSSTWTFRNARYDIEIVSPDGGTTSRLLDGQVLVRPEVTRA